MTGLHSFLNDATVKLNCHLFLFSMHLHIANFCIKFDIWVKVEMALGCWFGGVVPHLKDFYPILFFCFITHFMLAILLLHSFVCIANFFLSLFFFFFLHSFFMCPGLAFILCRSRFDWIFFSLHSVDVIIAIFIMNAEICVICVRNEQTFFHFVCCQQKKITRPLHRKML